MAQAVPAAASSAAMHALDLLGPVTLSRDGRPLPLTVRKTAALLVLLARGGPQPRSRIASLLWPALDEPTGRRNLRRELARLREWGADGVVATDGDRLLLHPEVTVDAARWTALEPEAALSLWRGVPFDGLDIDDAPPFMEWLAAERERLQAVCRQHLAAAAVAAHDRGELDAALRHLDRLLDDDPLQERYQRQAMVWLVAAGRREEALARYTRCRQVLQAELGLSPMAETEALAAALRGPGLPASAPEAPAPSHTTPVGARWAVNLPAQLPFVGREAEVRALERAWRERRLVLVEGEGGVGKSRLVLDVVAAHGPMALVRCHSSDEGRPLASVTRALRVLAGVEVGGASLPGWVRAELARVLPECGAPPPSLRSGAEQARFEDALAIAWRHWAEADFDAVVLDDWHLADEASQALLPRLFAPVAGEPALRGFVVHRPMTDEAAAERLARLSDGGALHLRLQPLAADAVLALLQQLSGADRPERFAHRLMAATGGHPFHLAETLQHLVELGLLSADADGVWHTPFDDQTEDYRELPVPASVREAVLGRVQRLPEPARRMLDAAALAGEPFDAHLLAPACALSEVEGDLALEQALEARLLQERSVGGYGFVHDLVPQAIASAMGAARQRLVHRRLALGAEAAGADAGRIARHFEAGGEPRRALVWRCRAGEAALRLHALAESIVHWRQARVDGGDALAGDEALAIGVGLVQALERQGDFAAARTEAMDLLARAERGEGRPAARVDAIVAAAGLLANRDEDARALQALDGLPSERTPRQRGAALRVRADALRGLGRIADCEAVIRQALAIPELPAEERARLHDALAMSSLAAGRIQEGLVQSEAAMAASREAGDSWGVARAQQRRAVMLATIGPAEEAEPALLAAAETAGRMGMVGQQRAMLFNLCVLHSSLSRPDRVLATARRCWDIPPPMGQEALRTQIRLAFVEAHVALGDLGQAWTWLVGAIGDAKAIGQLAGLASVLQTGLELLTLLDEQARGDELLTSLVDAEEVRHFVDELRIVRIECSLLVGALETARRLQAEQAPASEIERVGARQVIARAAVILAGGDAALALATLPRDDAEGMNDELRWRALAVRVDAEHALGRLGAGTRQAVQAALSRDGVHAVAQWLLHRALARAEPAQASACAARTAALAATLAGHPAQQAAFLQRWR